MGQLGRISSVNDLPPDEVLMEYIRSAVKLNHDGVKLAAKPAQPRTALIVPDYLLPVLELHPQVKINFQKFSCSQKKEYIARFNEAKTEETKQKRIATEVEWLSEGKARHWKYETK